MHRADHRANSTVPVLPKVVTAKVAARYVGLSESTLAKLRLNGNGPVYCKLGRRVVYRPADLELTSDPHHASPVRRRRPVFAGIDGRTAALSDGDPSSQSSAGENPPQLFGGRD